MTNQKIIMECYHCKQEFEKKDYPYCNECVKLPELQSVMRLILLEKQTNKEMHDARIIVVLFFILFILIYATLLFR